MPQPGSDQKSDGNAGQKTERIHADILNHSGAARDKELVEFISARIGGTGHSADQCFLHKLFGPTRFACAAKQMDGDGGADTESTVNINMCPLANVGIVVLAAEPLGGQAVSRGGFRFFRYLLAEGRGALPRLGGKQKDCRHDGQCNAQHHRAHKFQLIVLLRHSRTSAFHRTIMYNTHGILEKHTSFAVQNQAGKGTSAWIVRCYIYFIFYFIISALIGCKTAKRAAALTDCGPTYYFMRCGYTAFITERQCVSAVHTTIISGCACSSAPCS